MEKGKHTETAGTEQEEDPDSLLYILWLADSQGQMHGTAIRKQTNKKNNLFQREMPFLPFSASSWDLHRNMKPSPQT